jgi:hypothetical protein
VTPVAVAPIRNWQRFDAWWTLEPYPEWIEEDQDRAW